MSTRPASSSRLIRDSVAAMGHLGLWPGLYVAAAYVCFWQLAGAGPASDWPAPLPDARMIVAVLMASVGVYVFDRVKLASVLIDPADVVAQPARYAFLKPRAGAVRTVAISLIIGAMFVAHYASVLMPVVIATSLLGVIVYAPGPRRSRKRLKDVLGVKNLYAASGVVALAAVATLLIGPLSQAHDEAFWRLLPARLDAIAAAGALLLARVAVDAMICDIDDTASDAAVGTQTLPGAVGERRAFQIGIAARLVIAGAIPLVARSPVWVAIAWSCAGAFGALALVPIRHRALRDVVDVELALEALAVLVAGMIVR